MKLFTLSISMLAAILLVAASGPAVGEITDILDSDSFDWKYDFDVDGVTPDQNDLDGNSVMDFTFGGDQYPYVAGGTLTWSIPYAGLHGYEIASGADEIWQASGITWDTGYTIEAKVRVDSLAEEATEACYISATSAGEGSNGATGWLNLYPNKQTWGSTKQNLGIPADNSDDFHIFRIAQEPGADSFSIWRDGLRLKSEVAATYRNTGLNRMLFGDAGSAMGGDFEFEYFRFTSGAYRPSDETILIIPPPPVKVSNDFAYKYEMDVDPTDQASIDLDSNGVADWVNYTDTLVTVADGIMTMPDNSMLDSGILSPDQIWSNVGFTAADGFSFEINMQVIEQTPYDPEAPTPITSAMPLVFALSDSTEMSIMILREDGFDWQGIASWNMDTSDKMHSYRFARDADADGGLWWIWFDGILLTPDGTSATRTYTRDAVYFGPATGGASSGIVDVDYVRMENAAYAQEEAVLLPGDANRDNEVDVSDLGILATNYGTTAGAWWGQADFNGDGAVDVSDLGVLATNYGSTGPTAVPEPGMLTLVILASMSLLALRRRAS